MKEQTNPHFRHCLRAVVFAAAVASTPVVAHAMGDEEFVGPFASWGNVKANYGAAGDGVTDDTAAIQKALNALGPTNPTLYFPAGTYRITQTLSLAGQQYVNVIGQDPSNTTIIWAGSSGGTMLHINGVSYSRFDRLTFNGQGSAAIAVDQSKADGTSNYFDTSNEYTDDVFENSGIGLRCGYLGYGCAETSMLRDQFLNNTVAGVGLGNYNALDMFIWYSLFQNNAVGVTNKPEAGQFNVYNSIFEGSTTADITWGNVFGTFNFRNNYSTGSAEFINGGGTGAPDNVTIEGNIILDTTNTLSIQQDDAGPMLVIDNIVRSLAGASRVVQMYNNPPAYSGLFSMGNTFTGSAPTWTNGPYHSIQDQIVSRSAINPSPPALPGTPPNYGRQIFEASPTGSGTTCSVASPCSVQQAITNAANAEQAGVVHPVAHIPVGNYSIASTITVPATVNSGIQIIGDGYYSRLNWTGGGGAGPMIRLLGPSKAILRDFYMEGYGQSTGAIEVDNVDQPGSRVFMEQATLQGSQPNLFVDGLDYTNVELHDFYNFTSPTGTTSINVIGGASAAAGLWHGGVTNIFAGLSAGNYLSYGVSNGAHVVMRDIWNDNTAGGGQIANITGTSTFTYAGSMLALPTRGSLAVALNNFQGTAALVNLYSFGDINITGNGGTARVLGLGLVGPTSTGRNGTASGKTAFSDSVANDFIPAMAGNSLVINSGSCTAGTYTIASVVDAGHITLNTSPGTCSNAVWASGSAAFFANSTSPAAATEFLNGQTDPTPGQGGNSALPEQGYCDATFLTATLGQLRTEQPTLLAPLASGVTDIRIYRVLVDRFITGIHLEKNKN